ncbi:MAG: hypothetical protein U0893_09005 [Chloroflexota bacterium]
MTATPATVQASALSRFNSQTWQPSCLAINGQGPNTTFDPNTNLYWFVVVSLKDLSFLVSVTSSDETSVPPQVAAYANNPECFLFVIGNVLNGYNIPQGELYSFLQATGAGAGLAELEQTIAQLGTGLIVSFSYVLAATMAQQDMPGFESWSLTDFAVLNMQFMPVQVDGQWVYAPVQQFAASAAT